MAKPTLKYPKTDWEKYYKATAEHKRAKEFYEKNIRKMIDSHNDKKKGLGIHGYDLEKPAWWREHKKRRDNRYKQIDELKSKPKTVKFKEWWDSKELKNLPRKKK